MFNTVFFSGYKNSVNGHWQKFWYKELSNSYWLSKVIGKTQIA
ncbi:MAG: putative alpha/beta hydrolase family esterase [Granulosicoccus sp.]|jgi:predicted alpha/beta hydrolase family esterase